MQYTCKQGIIKTRTASLLLDLIFLKRYKTRDRKSNKRERRNLNKKLKKLHNDFDFWCQNLY